MKSGLRKHGVTLLIVLAFLAGVGLMAYPSVSNWWNKRQQTKVIMQYEEKISGMSPAQRKKILDEAKRYNERLAETGIRWKLTEEEKKEYNRQLSIDQTGVMGYISIPKIRVKLPIYHGTSEKTLQTSIGHLECSSLPVGGESAHCFVSGHRGLPSAKLFTDLDQLREGDLWTMTILDETLTYEVDQIRTVEPEDLSNLKIEQGKDYCTLITCTPYGVNTHRLLVRGHRTANRPGEGSVIADATRIDPMRIAPFIAIPLLLVILAWALAKRRRKLRKQS